LTARRFLLPVAECEHGTEGLHLQFHLCSGDHSHEII